MEQANDAVGTELEALLVADALTLHREATRTQVQTSDPILGAVLDERLAKVFRIQPDRTSESFECQGIGTLDNSVCRLDGELEFECAETGVEGATLRLHFNVVFGK